MNPYFTWEEHVDAAEGWRPFADLLDPDVVRERVGVSAQALVARYRLDSVPERVVASVLFLGYAARLVSPPLARGGVPDLTTNDVWWREVAGGPLPIAVRPHGETSADLTLLIERLVTPLLETFHHGFRLSRQVLWGNVASALGGAAGQLGTEAAWQTVDALLRRPPLQGMATVGDHRLYRRNCCLFYRIPGGGTCGDCVLNRRR